MREIKFKAVMQRLLDRVVYVSDGYSSDSSFLSYLFDFENNRWDIFIEHITTEQRFVKLFPDDDDDDEDLTGWSHIENIQYVGLKDKNGVEIYEYMEIDNTYEVSFLNGSYVLTNISSGDIMLLSNYMENNNGKIEITREYTKV